MRKSSVLLSCGLVVAIAGIAAAQDSALWFDIRNNTGAAGTIQNILSPRSPFTNGGELATAAFNGGMRGDGQKLWLEPVHTPHAAPDNYTETFTPNGYPNFDGDGNRSTGDLYLYLDMNDVAGNDDVYAALGININLTQAGGTPANSNRIGAIAFTLANDGTLGGTPAAPNPPWNNKTDGSVVAGDPPSWQGIKAVRVPVTSGPVYAASLGIQPGGPYRVGKLRVSAGPRNCPATSAGHATRSRISVKMAVNNLLIARVFSSGGDTQEDVALGYNNGSLATEIVNGNSNGATSATDDAVIEIRFKGDSNGDNAVNVSDTGGFTAAKNAGATLKQVQAFVFDANGDLVVNVSDTGGFTAEKNGSASCP